MIKLIAFADAKKLEYFIASVNKCVDVHLINVDTNIIRNDTVTEYQCVALN